MNKKLKINSIGVLILLLVFNFSFTSPMLAAQSSTSEKTEAKVQQKEVELRNQKLKEKEKEITKIKDEIKVQEEKISAVQDSILKLKKEVSTLTKESGQVLVGLQRLDNTTATLKLLGEADGVSDYLSQEKAQETLNGAILRSINRTLGKQEETEAKEVELKKQQKEKNKTLESLRSEYKQMEEDTKAALTASYTAAQSKTEQFFKSKGCGPGDVYGVDCGKGEIKDNKKFVRPLSGGYVTNEYGGFDIYGQSDGHTGVDIAGGNKNIYPAASGQVVAIFTDSYGGTQIVMIHLVNGKNYVTNYAHLADIDVVTGEKVGINKKIGTMGATGQATGIHLHFEVIKGPYYIHSKLENPRLYLNLPKGSASFSGRE